jgi:hypothetical protein
VELIKPVYNNIKVIILAVILIIVSSSSLVETLAQGRDIIYLIVYSDFSTNKKAEY